MKDSEKLDMLRGALQTQTDLVDRLTDAVDREANDIGGESSLSVLRELGPHLSVAKDALKAVPVRPAATDREIEQAWSVRMDGSRRNRITGDTQQPPAIAPVQGYSAGIPWSLHLEAYDAYCKKWSPQPALIDWNGRGCRGGFSTGELDDFIPGWRERVGAIAELKRRVVLLETAVRPFAEVAEQIAPEEPDTEWAKFRLVISMYRRAAAAMLGKSYASEELPDQ